MSLTQIRIYCRPVLWYLFGKVAAVLFFWDALGEGDKGTLFVIGLSSNPGKVVNKSLQKKCSLINPTDRILIKVDHIATQKIINALTRTLERENSYSN